MISGPNRQRARDAQALLLAARQRQRRFVEAIFHFIPDRRLAQALFDAVGQSRLSTSSAR